MMYTKHEYIIYVPTFCRKKTVHETIRDLVFVELIIS